MHTLKQQAIAAFGAIAVSGLGIGCAAAADVPVPPGQPEYYEGQNYGPAYPPPPQYGYAPPPAYGYPPPPVVYGYPPPPAYYAPPRAVVVPGPVYPRGYYGRPYPYPRNYARHGHWRHW